MSRNRAVLCRKILKSGRRSPYGPLRGAKALSKEVCEMIKKVLVTAAALAVLPVVSQAQNLQYPGFYAGIEGGGTWMFNTTSGTPMGSGTIYPALGWAAGGMIGYD